MKKAVLAAVAAANIAAWLPALGFAQTTTPPSPHSTINGHNIGSQLDQLGARIDRYLARGQISKAEAAEAHRELNALQDQASADREENGGQLPIAERFAMQGKIDDLNRDLRRERAARGGVPSN